MSETQDKNNATQTQKSEQRLLFIFTRTPLHVGAGASVGAIDQPIIRERHTGFPVIPASSIKGTFADHWNEPGKNGNETEQKVKQTQIIRRSTDGRWLFGEPDAENAAAGALQFSEARLLAFPVRSARGSFAWITCPLILARAARDGVFNSDCVSIVKQLKEPQDEQAVFPIGKIDLENSQSGSPVKQVVLEEYTFTRTAADEASNLGKALAELFDDLVWAEIKDRLIILSNGMMSFFARNACEVAQHVRINDETGTAASGALFNQENVPSETMFYCVINAFQGRGRQFKDKKPQDAISAFSDKLREAKQTFQFGGDASTGLGYCTVQMSTTKSNP